MAKLYYQGHGSYRITASDGRVIYIDPFAGDGYEPPADIVLVTHQHGDHNKLRLVTQKTGCQVITNEEALAVGFVLYITMGCFARMQASSKMPYLFLVFSIQGSGEYVFNKNFVCKTRFCLSPEYQ